MPRRKHKIKHVKHQQKKKLRTEEPKPPDVATTSQQPNPYESESEEESTYTSQSSSIPEEVFEDETQTSEVLPYYPEKPEEEKRKSPPKEDLSFKQLAEAFGPLHLTEIKPGPIRPEITPGSLRPSTSKDFSDQSEQIYEAVVTQTETLPSAASAKRPRLAESKLYKITRNFPGKLSADEYSSQKLNLKSYEQAVIGVPRGIAFQFYNCKEFFLSVNQVDLYIIDKKGSSQHELASPHHTHVHFPGEIYMCKKTNAEGIFSKSNPTSKIKENVTHVHIKSIDDVMASTHPGFSRLPQYIFVKSAPFAKTQFSFPAQPSDLLYPSDIFELLFSAYTYMSPELNHTFSYFRMIPGNFDILLGVPKNALYEEYHCCPKIISLSGIDLYFMGKERADPDSKNVQKFKSSIHTHVQFPHGVRACMFRNSPTKYILHSSCPHELEVTSFVHIPTSAVPPNKTTMKTASLVKETQAGTAGTSAMEEVEEEFSESELSSSSSSSGEPNCYLELIAPKKGTVFIGMPKEALCHHNPETNELEALTGVGIYFVKETDLEVCPKASAITPHHVHLNFNSDAYLCRFNGDAIVYDIDETCTRLSSAPATRIMAPALNVLPKGKPIRPAVSGRPRTDRKQKYEILKTSNPFGYQEKSTPTLVPIMHDVATTSFFGRMKSSQSFTSKSEPESFKRVILKRREPKVIAATQPLSMVPATSATTSTTFLDVSRFDELVTMLFTLFNTLFNGGGQMEPRGSQPLELLQERWPQIEMQSGVAIQEIQPDLDPLEMQSSSELLEMQPCPELVEMQPIPDPHPMRQVSIPPHVQSSLDSLAMRDSPDLLEMQSNPEWFHMQRSPEQIEMRPSPESPQMESIPEPCEMQDSPEMQSTTVQHEMQMGMGEQEIETGMDPSPREEARELESMRMDIDTPSPQE